MASFAQLDENNTVINVIKIENNDEIIDQNGNESEELGIQKCKTLFGENTNWIQTWFGNPPEKRYRPAIVGGLYLPEHDVFTDFKKYKNWDLDLSTYTWQPPTPKPESDPNFPIDYRWDDDSVSWVEYEIPKPDVQILQGQEEWRWSAEFGWIIVNILDQPEDQQAV